MTDTYADYQNRKTQTGNIADALAQGLSMATSTAIAAIEATTRKRLWDEYEAEAAKIIGAADARAYIRALKANAPSYLFGALDEASKERLIDWQDEVHKKLSYYTAHDAAYDAGDWFWEQFGYKAEPKLNLVEASRLARYQKLVADNMGPKLTGILRRAKIDLKGWTREDFERIKARAEGAKVTPGYRSKK